MGLCLWSPHCAWNNKTCFKSWVSDKSTYFLFWKKRVKMWIGLYSNYFWYVILNRVSGDFHCFVEIWVIHKMASNFKRLFLIIYTRYSFWDEGNQYLQQTLWSLQVNVYKEWKIAFNRLNYFVVLAKILISFLKLWCHWSLWAEDDNKEGFCKDISNLQTV